MGGATERRTGQLRRIYHARHGPARSLLLSRPSPRLRQPAATPQQLAQAASGWAAGWTDRPEPRQNHRQERHIFRADSPYFPAACDAAINRPETEAGSAAAAAARRTDDWQPQTGRQQIGERGG